MYIYRPSHCGKCLKNAIIYTCEPTTQFKKQSLTHTFEQPPEPLCGGRVTLALHPCLPSVTNIHDLGSLFPLGVFILLYTFTR